MNNKLDLKDFNEIREDVLETWHTGKGLKIEDGIKYQSAIPEEKNFASVMSKAKNERNILLQPRAGVALVDEHIKLLRFLEDEGGADLLPTTIDAYTRQNRYKEAEIGIEKSSGGEHSLLNGFPAVNHGVPGCRRVIESITKPIEVRHGTPDARLLAEISLISGFTGFEGGGISYNIPYSKKITLEQSIRDWQYVDRLVGIYEENGIHINREPFGPLTGTLVPPFVGNTVAIIEGLLALKQGVKSITLGYGQGGNLMQDVAAIISLKILAHKYFKKEGFTDYDLTTVFHQWMGGFPNDESKAHAVIVWGGVAGISARVDKIIVKTPEEAMGIPTMQANANGLKATRQIVNMLKDQHMTEGGHLREEVDVIISEVTSIMDKLYELGDGDIAIGTIEGFKSGIIDVPFAPSIYNNGKILPIRDNEGFIRIFNWGNIAVNDSIKSYHKEKLAERAKVEEREISFQMVTDDIYAISKGRLVGRPR